MPVRCVQYLVCCGSLLFMMSSPHSTAQSIRRSIALACCANQLRQLRTKKKHSSQGCSNGYIPGEVENCMQIFSYKSMRYHFRAVNSADIYVAIPMLMSLFRAPTPVQDWYMYHYNVVCTVCAMTNSAG